MDRQYISKSAKQITTKNRVNTDDPEAALISRRKREMRKFKSGRCAQIRIKCKAIFRMRKYLRAVLALTGIEATLVVIRLVLEIESLRYPPGTTYKSLIHSQLFVFCLSLPILVLFVIEQPLKWWAFGSIRYCRSVLLVMDALICVACLSLNIYNIQQLATRSDEKVVSPQQLSICSTQLIAHAPNTGWTFAVASGILILFRCWCIHGYVNKSIQTATDRKTATINSLQRQLDLASSQIAELEDIIRGARQASNKGPTRTPTTNNSRRPGGHESRQSRKNQETGESV